MQKKIFLVFILLIAIILLGFGIDVMDIDASQYASMSREMMSTGNYLQVYDLGSEYLDKPPFLFWVSATSMKIFGVNNFGYRFPSLLFSILALISTYKLARLYYSNSIALLAALVLASCQGFFLMNHDIRTDTILMGWVALSLWQLAAWNESGKFGYFFLGCAAIAGGMMTKGPIALLVPVFAFGSHFVLQRKFKSFFRWEYLAGLFIIAAFLVPMCIGLYRQFDLHPEKTVNGQTGVSGLRFFFWTQSFGRITGESTWNNNSNIFFLLQNMLWSFLPWILFFLAGLFFNLKEIIRRKFSIAPCQEAISTGGFILTYVSLGLSKYQLPHYIFVAFPLAAIITAAFLHRLIYEKKYPRLHNALLYTHFILFTLLWAALICLLAIPFDTIPLYISILAAFLMANFIFLFVTRRKQTGMLLAICLYSILGINLFLNASFYPALLGYQAGSTAGRWLAERHIPLEKTYLYKYKIWRSLNFYAKGIIENKDSARQINPGDYILTTENKLPELGSNGISYHVLYRAPDYPVSRLSLKFLNPKTRKDRLTYYVLIRAD
jgi:4-amino-4-deoxy-L-arabinose transferase-like glycosyltransferase